MSVTRNGFNGATRPNGFDPPKWLEPGSWDRCPTDAFTSMEDDRGADLNGKERKAGNGYQINGEQIEKKDQGGSVH
jgi:hypothetical protein